ncbi:peroxidase family protein [Pseudorhizobium marinum]|uniref:peroxidase family protein n=1 Tax=Pseudorhizobium marinum TaxID=1496690 RepID=UPI0004956A4E|nr:peroxidase family protein [Pseudorhizobium marinum]
MSALSLNLADLQFILRQIKIAEANSTAHAATGAVDLREVYVDAAGNTMDELGTPYSPDTHPTLALTLAIPDPHVPYGLRTVDGSYNNLVEGREMWGASGEPMPRLFEPNYINNADGDQMPFGGPGAPVVTNTDYGVINGVPTNPNVPGGNGGHTGNVADADPRTISNLVVDMSMNNPAAILAALTFAGSEDPMADLAEIMALNLSLAEASAALDAATTALEDANAALDAAVLAYVNNIDSSLTSSLINAIQQEAEDLTVAEAQYVQAQAVASNPQAAMIALAEEKGLTFNNGSLDIPNIAPDEGLSAPFNAWMTFFGQFFDHGLDLISKGGNGTIYIPLAADDPLVTHGPDGVAGTGDEAGPNNSFMVLTRSTTVIGPDGEPTQRNVTTPFVDQNQTYTSHASHQVFLREYALDAEGKPIATGKLLGGADGGLATWGDVKAQALQKLGIELTDMDVFAVPLLRTDAYGEFIRDPVTGFAQVIVGLGLDGIPNTDDDIVESGTPDAPVDLFAVGAIRTNNAFLDDIAHDAVPGTVFDPDGPAGPAGDTAVAADVDEGVNTLPIDTDFRGRKVAYDDELLDRHFITGDGRGNENIGLTAVHHVFHSEHNRQVDQQKVTILTSGDLDFVNEWLAIDTDAATLAQFIDGYAAATDKALFLETSTLFNGNAWDGERLFQAARVATEMQYQHLVFEEFGRKIQPNIDVFVFNNVTDVDPRIFGEFANVVYRFGHSMLTENMPRIGPDGQIMDSDQLTLIESFLNPVLFDNDGSISHDEGAAAIVRGMTIERGNEIDEFITGALRNNLLGLPLDLAAINIARGRDTGMPTLNEARQQLFDASGSSFLTPYASWTEFAANLKNPLSVVNFIAAYGKHSTIPQNGTLEAKRDAAWLLVFGGAGAPSDRLDFLNSTGAFSAANTGLNDIDLWIGGLAEKKMPFGGMLGSTFNAVFELQMENLQDGDRFYYLTRTQGQNFLNSLEQNSFAKLIMANTNLANPGADGIRGTADDIVERHIGVDSFATYDYVLEVDATKQVDYNGAAPGVDPLGNDPTLEALGLTKVVRDDPGTAGVDSNYIRFFGGEHVVLGGTVGNDTIIGDFGDDGIWGDMGDDRIEAGAGVDLVNGGAGNDIITDSGDTGDFLKGDEGDDVIANSNGLDILMGGSGKDVFFVGVDATEVFAGQGDDFILGGDDMDFLLGNEGDDWMEGGGGFDTTAGDNSELFFNSAIKGHDVMFAGNDEHDFDAESGDDIMVQGESVIRNEGMFGFDWSIYKGVSFGADADLRVPIFTTEQQDILRNRFDKTEALSGWDHDDILRGDDRVTDVGGAATVGTAEGVFFQDELTQAGVDRIDGLRALLGDLIDAPTGATDEARELEIAFDEGNILLGGGGNDLLQGNGGNDFLDGDAWLNVRIRITGSGEENSAANEIATVDSLKHVFAAGEGPAAWSGKSLFDLMISRTIVPDQLHIVREIIEDDGIGDIDIAVFSDVRANYTVTSNEDGTITVAQNAVTAGVIDPLTGRNLVSDGVDTLRNFEALRFADGEIALTPPELYLQRASSSYADDFNTASFGNSVGTTPWVPDWVEVGDSGGVTTGQIQIDPGGAGTNVMRLSGTGVGAGANNGAMITRTMDLSGASAATVSYTIAESGLEQGEWVRVFFAADGTNFVQLNEITSAHPNSQAHTHDVAGPFSANAAIRFEVSALTSNDDIVTVNDLAITFSSAPSMDYMTTFTEGNGAAPGADVDIASSPLIVEDGVIVSARIVLTNPQAGDSFDVPGNLPGNINSTVATVGGQLVVTLTGNEPNIAQWQAAIQAIEFRNNSQAPSETPRIIQVTVNDGLLNSNVATTTVNVVSVNDAPNAVTDNVVTNIAGPIVVPEWMMLRNDTDAEGSPLTVTGAVENDFNFTIAYDPATRGVTATRSDGDNTKDFTYTISDGALSASADVDITWDTAGALAGGNGADIILGDVLGSIIQGNGGNDLIIGGQGDDIIDGGTGDDEIHWTVGDGRDFINGGLNEDTVVINGDAANEAFVVYSRQAALANGITDINGTTEIVITRNGVIAVELDNVEEIIINTGDGNDSVFPLGNFVGTSLNFNTITINGGTGDDTIDVSGLTSAHRVVFRSNGGNDTIVGTIRAQDVIELAPGQDISTYSLIDNGNGTQSFSNGSHSITFAGPVPPQFQNTPPAGGNDEGVSGAFEYTPTDLAGLKALVNGLVPASEGDDEVPTGVRELSGYGNNESNPNWGSADQTFIRITNPHYGAPDADGNRAINPIFDGLDPRTISNILGAQEADLPDAGNDANIFFMAMGQYIDHGLDFLPKGGNGSIAIGGVGGGDPFSGNPADLTRATVVGYDEDGTPLHKNQTSPYVDQNQAYGSNSLVGQFLRESDGNQGYGMRLFSGAPDPSNPDFNLLPTLRELIQHHWQADTIFTDPGLPGGQISFRTYYTNYAIDADTTGTLFDDEAGTFDPGVVSKMISNFMGSGHPLLLDTNPFIDVLDHYIAGDGRANENFALTSIHTIWARNHNHHVDGLLAAGFEGTEEEVFQAAKMINEAEYQRVVFDEYLETLLGGLRSEGTHGFEEYDPNANAAISHEFAAAAFRFGHSLIGEKLTVLDAEGNPVQVNLFDAFLNPSNAPGVFTGPLPPGYVPQPGYAQHGVNAIISGNVSQPSEAVDFNIVDAVRNDLVRISADLFAFNVARGWDVGLGTLNQIRMDLAASTDPYVSEAVGFAGGNLSAYSSWADFQARNGLSNTVIAQFMAAYPDLILAADDIAAFQAINPDIQVAMQQDGTGIVKGIDRVDFWVGGLAEAHINGGIVGETFWVVLSEQFERLQDADRFYYISRFDDFDFYQNFIDGQDFADIVARNTGLTDLPEHMFQVDEIDEDEGEDDTPPVGNGDDDDDDDTPPVGSGDDDDDDEDEDDDDDTDDDDTDGDEDDGEDDDDDDDQAGNEDGGNEPLPVAARMLIGTAAADVLTGAAAADTLLGGGASDILVGEDGNDILRGEDGNDVVSGGSGNDTISGGAGEDELHGGAGDDMLFGNADADMLHGGLGDDFIEAGGGEDQAWGGEDDDLFISTANDGNDRYWGDAGSDTLDYSVATGDLTVDLGNGFMGRGQVSGGNTGTDVVYGFENFVGGSGHDVITATTAVNIMDGGGGNDTFRFTSAAAADGDTIFGFRPGDKIDFSAIDGNTALSGLQSFTLSAGSTLTAAGQVVVSVEMRDGEEVTVIHGNVDANMDADFELTLIGRHTLTASDFTGVS